MSGWQQTGVVKVSSHPGFAYAQLWRNISDMFRWFLLSAVLASLLGGFAPMALKAVARHRMAG